MKKYAVRCTLLSLSLTISACSYKSQDIPPQEIQFDLPISIHYEYVGMISNAVILRDTEKDRLISMSTNGEIGFSIPYPEEVLVLHDVVRCKTEDTYTYLAYDGQELPASDFAYALFPSDFQEELDPTENERGLWGYTDRNGKWVIEPQYTFASRFVGNLAYVEIDQRFLYGFIDRSGAFEPLCIYGDYNMNKYDSFYYPARPFDFSDPPFVDGRLLLQTITPSQGIASVYITDENDELFTELPHSEFGYPYQNARDFSDGFAAVQANGKWGYIDLEGHIAIDLQFKDAFSFLNGTAIVETAGNVFYYISKDGNLQQPLSYIPSGYKPTGLHFGELIVVKDSENDQNIVNSTGDLIFKAPVPSITLCGESDKNDPIWSTGKGYYLPGCQKNIPGRFYEKFDGSIIIDHSSLYDIATGEQIFFLKENAWISKPVNGLALIKTAKGKYGYIEPSGKWFIEPIFDEASDFHDGIAYARIGSTAGLLIRQGTYGDSSSEDKGEHGDG